MTDKKPSKEPIQPKSMSGKGLERFLLSAFAGAMIGKVVVDTGNEFANLERERVQQVSSLERKLVILEQEVSGLDAYLTLAEEGTIDASQCDIADVILESSEIVQQSATQQRKLLSQVDYVSVSESISYRKRQDEASQKIKARAGQLQDICQHLFAKEITVVQQNYNVPAGWWDRPEISFNYDQ